MLEVVGYSELSPSKPLFYLDDIYVGSLGQRGVR